MPPPQTCALGDLTQRRRFAGSSRVPRPVGNTSPWSCQYSPRAQRCSSCRTRCAARAATVSSGSRSCRLEDGVLVGPRAISPRVRTMACRIRSSPASKSKSSQCSASSSPGRRPQVSATRIAASRGWSCAAVSRAWACGRGQRTSNSRGPPSGMGPRHGKEGHEHQAARRRSGPRRPAGDRPPHVGDTATEHDAAVVAWDTRVAVACLAVHSHGQEYEVVVGAPSAGACMVNIALPGSPVTK
jgi:hypothetical protein